MVEVFRQYDCKGNLVFKTEEELFITLFNNVPLPNLDLLQEELEYERCLLSGFMQLPDPKPGEPEYMPPSLRIYRESLARLTRELFNYGKDAVHDDLPKTTASPGGPLTSAGNNAT